MKGRFPSISACWLHVLSVGLVPACDNAGRLTDMDAATASPLASTPVLSHANPASPSAPVSATVALVDTRRSMPPRPVPIASPTVRITMPMDVQLQAIQYMAAMQAPQPGDAPADPAYAQQIADALRAIGKTDVVSSGRRIDIAMARGCDPTLPREALARRTSASLTTLLAHGVLVVRCADRGLQCLQSTRDADDVLCTHK
jgi:hypothetical protein